MDIDGLVVNLVMLDPERCRIRKILGEENLYAVKGYRLLAAENSLGSDTFKIDDFIRKNFPEELDEELDEIVTDVRATMSYGNPAIVEAILQEGLRIETDFGLATALIKRDKYAKEPVAVVQYQTRNFTNLRRMHKFVLKSAEPSRDDSDRDRRTTRRSAA